MTNFYNLHLGEEIPEMEKEGVNDVSIEIVEMFILGQNPEEFRNFIKNNDIIYLIDLLEEESVKRNPIRKIIEENNPELYINFDKLVEDFVNNIDN